jgi:hypothetical protein
MSSGLPTPRMLRQICNRKTGSALAASAMAARTMPPSRSRLAFVVILRKRE